MQKVADDAGIELEALRACGRSVHRTNATVQGMRHRYGQYGNGRTGFEKDEFL